MVRFNNTDKVMSLKLVYVGCALGGKTTSLEKIHERIAAPHRSRLVSLNTSNDRTLFFDLLPLDLGQISGYAVTLQLFTVPGQVQYTSTRRAVLTAADAVVVVVDSHPDRMRENREAIHELSDHLKFHGLDIREMPLVLQYNKRDLPDALHTDELNHNLNPRDWPWFESVAKDGTGIMEPFLKAAVRMADTIVARYKFPLTFGDRLYSSLERLMIPAKAPPAPVQAAVKPASAPQLLLPVADGPAESGATLDFSDMSEEAQEEALAETEDLNLEGQTQTSGADGLHYLQEILSRTGMESAGGGRQRIQSSIDSSEAVDLQLLLQGAIEAHESMAKIGTELDRATERLKLREGQLADLGRICRWSAAQQPLQEVFEQILKTMVKSLQAAGSAILVPTKGSRALQEMVLEGFGADPINSLPCKGFPSLASGLFHRACPSVSPDPAGSVNPVDRHLARWNIVSHIASPLASQGQVLGMMTAYRVAPYPVFDKADIAYFSAICSLISTAIELNRLRSPVDQFNED